MLQPHWETLNPGTRDAFRLISGIEFISQYYLAGGTGLALHLGHRISVDLDLFSNNQEAVNLLQRSVMRTMFEYPSLSITYDMDTTFVCTWHGVDIGFFRLNSYPLVTPVTLLDGVPIASIEEIGAMKLAAIIGRGTRKDLVDLYYILQIVPLEQIFEVANVKYAKVNTFPVTAARALSYFDDAEMLPMPNMLEKTSWNKMKKFLNAKSIEAGRKHLDIPWG